MLLLCLSNIRSIVSLKLLQHHDLQDVLTPAAVHDFASVFRCAAVTAAELLDLAHQICLYLIHIASSTIAKKQ